jgi:hypothetical protein
MELAGEDGGVRSVDGVVDGYGLFEIDLPHQGLVRLASPLDFERVRAYRVTIEASVRIITLF